MPSTPSSPSTSHIFPRQAPAAMQGSKTTLDSSADPQKPARTGGDQRLVYYVGSGIVLCAVHGTRQPSVVLPAWYGCLAARAEAGSVLKQEWLAEERHCSRAPDDCLVRHLPRDAPGIDRPIRDTKLRERLYCVCPVLPAPCRIFWTSAESVQTLVGAARRGAMCCRTPLRGSFCFKLLPPVPRPSGPERASG